MSIDLKLSNTSLISYVRTDDALEAFKRSVNNGQARLAIEVLVELIDGLVEEIESLKEKVFPEELELALNEEPQHADIANEVAVSPIEAVLVPEVQIQEPATEDAVSVDATSSIKKTKTKIDSIETEVNEEK